MQRTFTVSEYYRILGLPENASVEEIKKAYRSKARIFHPDVNHNPDAKDLFIRATEAYEFLLAYHEKLLSDEEAYKKAMEEWRKYRQQRAQKRAHAYARTSYRSFRNTKFYRSTRILDGTTILFSFAISLMVIIYAIYGYVYRLRNPIPGLEKPSVFTLIMLLLLGLTFMSVSFIYLIAYLDSSKKKKK